MASIFTVAGKLLLDTKDAARSSSRLFDGVAAKGKKAADSIGARLKKALGKGAIGVAKAGLTGVIAGVTGGLISGAKTALDFNRVLEDVRIQSGASASEMANLASSITDTSRATAISKVELAETSKRLVDLLGPTGRSAELMDLLGRTAVASGANTAELAGLISSVSDSMGIAATDTKRMEGALSAFLAAGKAGKVPLEEMALVLQDVSSTFKEVSTGGVDAAADLAAALQVARKSFGSAAKAGTGLEAFIGSLVKKSKQLKDLEVDVFIGEGADKKLRPLRDILDQIQSRGLNVKQLTDALGRKEAAKLARVLTSEAGRKQFDEISDAARGATDVADDFAKRTAGGAFKVDQAMNGLKLTISDIFTAERMEGLIGGLQIALGLAGDLLSTVGDIGDTLGGVGETLGEAVFDAETALFGQGASPVEQFREMKRIDELAAARATLTASGALQDGAVDPRAVERARVAASGPLGEIGLSAEEKALLTVAPEQTGIGAALGFKETATPGVRQERPGEQGELATALRALLVNGEEQTAALKLLNKTNADQLQEQKKTVKGAPTGTQGFSLSPGER